MTEFMIQLTEEEFDEQFPLVSNHLNASAGWALGESGGCLFETYGAELAFVKPQDTRHVWTLMDCDDGSMALASGLHFVNRIGYLVSTVPVPDQTFIEVRIKVSEVESAEGDG